MKKFLSLALVLVLCISTCLAMTACEDKADYTVGICQLMEHDSLDQATEGFISALTTALEAEGKTVEFDTQVAGDTVGVLYCTNESNSLIQYEAVKELFEAEEIVVKAYTFSETTELQTLVPSLASECKALYVPSDNTVAQNDSVVGTICTDTNVPVFTSYGGTICYASLAIDYYVLGEETGKMAAEILLGNKTTADFEIKTLTPTVVYNEELCADLGITVPTITD